MHADFREKATCAGVDAFGHGEEAFTRAEVSVDRSAIKLTRTSDQEKPNQEKRWHARKKKHADGESMRATFFARTMKEWIMALKVCGNAACAFHGHVLYATGTRCRLCGWDLQRTLPKSEAKLPKSSARSQQRASA